MNFVIVITDHKEGPPKATVCAEYQQENVRTRHVAEGKPGDVTWVVPAECHWSAEVRHPTTPEDIDGQEVW
jgi:hypothetical protein